MTMQITRSVLRTVVAIPLLLVVACGGAGEPGAEPEAKRAEIDPAVAEELAHQRNLGKAFYENSTTQYDAIAVLQKAWELNPGSSCDHANYALALLRAGQTEAGVAELEKVQAEDPELPHTWFNLGITYKQASEYDKARAQFERMVELVPDEPISHFNLGALYKLADRNEDALAQFQTAAELDPNLAGPWFQLASVYRQLGRTEETKNAMRVFRELKARNENAAIPEDLEWSYFAELCDIVDPTAAPAPGLAAELAFETTSLAEALDPAGAGVELIDLGGDGTLEVLVFDASGMRVVGTDGVAVAAGLGDATGVVAVAPADVDDDGLMDLAVIDGDGAALYLQRAGTFRRDHKAAWPAGSFHSLLWLDWDHDYDLDLFLLGVDSRLVRNDGKLPDAERPDWSDQTAAFPFVEGEIVAAAMVDSVPDTQGWDLAALQADGSATFYRDRLAGVYEAEPLDAVPAGARRIVAFDLDNDSRTDLLTLGAGGVTYLRNERRGFVATALAGGTGTAIAFADLENRGLSDLVTAAGVHRNQGLGEFATPVEPEGLPAAVALAAADLDQDGRTDLVSLGQGGRLELALNGTETSNQFIGVSFTGNKNMKLAPGAEVEVKAGRRYQKKTYRGRPLHFGLGGYAEVDTVRITWPNGLIQNESAQPAGQYHHYEEAQRLSGSCPMIYTWDGEGFRFISDVLGVAPLGAASGDGETFPVDHDEHVQIPADALVERDGRLEIRIVEELREVAFIDQIQLIAVEREAGLDVFVSDKFQGPPFPHELVLYGARDREYPIAAVNGRGHDVLDRLTARDRRYVDDFERSTAAVAETHTLELDFGTAAADNQAVLVLDGWVDWADGSTFLATSQNPGAELVTPYLEVLDQTGEWQVVVPDMGMPAGKPKTIVVDLRDKFLSAERRVRITTNVCVYWDEIFLAADAVEPPVRATTLLPAEAALRFAGFSRPVIHPERKQPETFVYAERSPTSMWNPTKGLYTRYGDVAELLGAADDRFVVMGSGDEIRLIFDPAALPPVPPGHRRDWVIEVDGWAKDGDANTIYSQTVEPLPFHGMPAYPYPDSHRYPDAPEHREYLETYNTRPALVLIRPLTEGISRTAVGADSAFQEGSSK